MLCQIAKLILSFHIVGLKEVLRQIIGVDAQAACQVYKRLPLQQACFICCTRLRRALFDGKVRRKKQIFVFSPLRHFFLQQLSGGYLPQSQRNVNADGRLFQGERRHIGIQVFSDELSCYFVQVQIFFRFTTSRSVRKRHSPRGSLYLSRPANMTRSSLVTS